MKTIIVVLALLIATPAFAYHGMGQCTPAPGYEARVPCIEKTPGVCENIIYTLATVDDPKDADSLKGITITDRDSKQNYVIFSAQGYATPEIPYTCSWITKE